jgi:hypothetical protein
MGCLDAVAAVVYAQARSMLDWNQRNKVSMSIKFRVFFLGLMTRAVLSCLRCAYILNVGWLESFLCESSALV